MKKLDGDLLQSYIEAVKDIYGIHIIQIILYGSYARNEATEDSDIDIMILVDLSDEEIKKYHSAISDISFDYLMDYGMDIKPITKNNDFFEMWYKDYPFFSSVKYEGVILYDAA